MKSISRTIKRHLLEIPLHRPSPDRVPRSGDAALAVDCYTTRVLRKLGDPLIVEAATGDTIHCLEHDGDRFSIKRDFDFDDLLKEEFEFTHFHGLATTTYQGWLDLALGRIFRIPYIKAWFYFKRSDFAQGLYNRRKLVTKDRIDLLKTILNAQLNGTDRLSSLSVMSLIHSDRWYLHPNKKSEHHRVKFYLEALADTNDLRRIGIDYQITGKGIESIEVYEEQERKHSENISTQKKMFFLTIVIAALTVVQAGLIKLPALLNFTKAP